MCVPTTRSLSEIVEKWRSSYPELGQRTLANHINNAVAEGWLSIKGNPGWHTIYGAIRRFDKKNHQLVTA